MSSCVWSGWGREESVRNKRQSHIEGRASHRPACGRTKAIIDTTLVVGTCLVSIQTKTPTALSLGAGDGSRSKQDDLRTKAPQGIKTVPALHRQSRRTLSRTDTGCSSHMISIVSTVGGGASKQGRMAPRNASGASDDVAGPLDDLKQGLPKTTSAACLVKVVIHTHGNETGEAPYTTRLLWERAGTFCGRTTHLSPLTPKMTQRLKWRNCGGRLREKKTEGIWTQFVCIRLRERSTFPCLKK